MSRGTERRPTARSAAATGAGPIATGPRRILVTGNAGSGKTTLAGVLAARTGLPLAGLDAVVWRTGWRKVPRSARRQRVQALCAGDVWIIEGVADVAEARADCVVWLDVPEAVCLRRARRRCRRVGRRTRPELPPRCPEIAIRSRLTGIIRGFRPTARRLARLQAAARVPMLRLRGFRHADAEQVLDWLATQARSRPS